MNCDKGKNLIGSTAKLIRPALFRNRVLYILHNPVDPVGQFSFFQKIASDRIYRFLKQVFKTNCNKKKFDWINGKDNLPCFVLKACIVYPVNPVDPV
jgi:hypothetical protein